VLNQAADPFGIIGQVLDSQFRVDRLVGEGGFSAVYRGHHLGLDEPIAIKCLKLPPSLSRALVDQFVKRFRDESRILYRLSQGNLNIVRSIAGGTWQSPVGVLVPFMVLEWMEGRSLANEFTIRRTVGKQGRSLDEVLKVFASAADGIAYAHAQGVIHRDLNPGNFFFTSSPQGQRLKVLDFGVAKILDDSTLNIERMQTVGQIRIFAPAYGSPEQFDDSLGKVGAASDVYAFALILLEALRDRPVNDGTHLGEFAQRAIDRSNRPTPRALGVDVPDEVEAIFARATRLQPRERWQSVAEFWNALTNAVSAAKEQRYAQAATETPSLGMPQPASRSTKTGMAPPAQQGKLPMKRMDKTVPVGAVLPPVPGPGRAAPSPPRPASPGSTSRVEAARPPPPPPDTRDADGAYQEEATKVGVVVADIPTFSEEGDGDEVTRLNSPAPDVLAHMADVAARAALPAGTIASVSNQNQPPPRGPAGRAPDAQSQPGFPAAQPQPPGRPPMAGTMMMNQGGAGFGPLPPPPQRGHQPMAGPPVGMPPPQAQMPTTQGIGPAGPPPGYPPPQMQQQPPMHHQPPMQPQMPPPNYQQAPPQIHQQHQAPSVPQGGSSLAPDGVPKKSNAMLILGIVGGLIVLGGVGALVVIVASGSPKAGQVTSASVTAVAPPAPMPAPEPASAPTPEQPAAPTPTEEADKDKGAVAANPTPETPPPPAPPTPPAPQPVVNNGGGWQPAPAPQPAKSAAPPVDPDAFNEGAARSTLSGAAVAFCKKEGGVSGPGSATVTFNPDGSVASVAMDAPYAGTPTGDCVKGLFQRSKTKPWKGSPQSVKTSFDVPK
jgi:serine/threonine protein kinase